MVFPLSCKLNQLEIVKYFITTRKMGIETPDKEGFRPIHIACQYGSLPIIEYLISLGCDLNYKIYNVYTPFIIACIHNYFSIAEYFLKNLKFDFKSQNLNFIFQISCYKTNLELVKFLIEHGYDPCIPDDKGELPIINSYNGRIIEYIMTVFKNDKNIVDSNGRTFLHYAALFDDIELIQYLINSLHIDKDIKDDKEMTPLHFAGFMGKLKTVKYLISIDSNKDSIDKFGRSPLHYAFLNDHIRVYEYLISIGANPSIEDFEGKTPSSLIHLKLYNNAKYSQIIEDLSMPAWYENFYS